MRIAISGLSGSGKNTIGSVLAKELGYELVSPTFKDLAKKEGLTLMEFQKKAELDKNIDRKFDAFLKESAVQDCVITTWLGPWIVDADIRICLFAPIKTRAKRIAHRDEMDLEKALLHVKERDLRNQKRYQNLYGIDIMDYNVFDICINSEKYKPKKILGIILEVIRQRRINDEGRY